MTNDDDWLLAELRRIGRAMRRPKAKAQPDPEPLLPPGTTSEASRPPREDR